MKRLFVIGLILLSLGCIRVTSYVKPDINFSTLKRITLIKFKVQNVHFAEFSQDTTKPEPKSSIKPSPMNESFSKILTDAMAMAFIKRGFNVSIDENIDTQAGLTEEIKNKLASAKIDAVVMANVMVKRKLMSEDMSLSANMYDVRNGNLLWSANVVEFDIDEINKVAEKMVDTINPLINE